MSRHEQTEPTRPRCARLFATIATIVLTTSLGCGSVQDKPAGADAGAEPTADATAEPTADAMADAGPDLDAAPPPRCGDGNIDDGENCDDGNTVTEHCAYGEQSCTVCTESCTMGPGIATNCGDGNVDPEEQCDDGNTVTEACAYGATSCTVCASNCQMGPGVTSYCGDGTQNGPEQCDDGNTVTEACAYGQTSCTVCNASCNYQAGQTAYCGDGTINGGEQCEGGTNATCAGQGYAGGVVSCTACKVDTSGCYSNTPQITSLSWWGTGNNPGYNWPQGTWILRMIFVDPNGNLLGNLSDKWQTSASGNVYYLLRLNTQYGVPSTDYKLRVYRTMQGDFSLTNLSWVGYADYSCNDGGNIASYCKAGTDIDGPWLRHGDFSLPY